MKKYCYIKRGIHPVVIMKYISSDCAYLNCVREISSWMHSFGLSLVSAMACAVDINHTGGTAEIMDIVRNNTPPRDMYNVLYCYQIK